MLNLAYLFQNIGTNFSASRGEPLHTRFTLRGLQERGHNAILVALHGRQVICSGELDAITGGRLTQAHYGGLGLSGNPAFKLLESAVRRVQRETKIPYYALFDSFRTYDAVCRNLKGFHLVHERYNAPALGGVLACKRLGIPYVLEVIADLLEQRAHRGVPERGLRRLMCIYATRLAAGQAAKIVCSSAVMKDHLAAKWRLDPAKLAVLPAAADIDLFAKDYRPDLVRRELGLDSEPVVMWVGGFYIWQDLNLLAESFSRVLGAIPRAKLVIVGDGETRPAFERTIESSGIKSSVVMVGAVPFQKVPELLSAADVAVSPSPAFLPGTGGTPVKIFEYMAAGKALIATRLDQFSAVIDDNQTGVLVPPGDADAFTAAITRLLSDRQERERLGQNARRRARERHSWAAYAKQLEEIYLSVL